MSETTNPPTITGADGDTSAVQKSHVRHGRGAVRPYLHGPLTLPHFLQEVFDAVEVERVAFNPQSAHVELQIGDATVVVEAGALPAGVQQWTGSVYVYVADVDAAYQRAMALGARSIAPPQDKPYLERQAGFVDAAGNTWWVATCKP